jgi:hypothetical protein
MQRATRYGTSGNGAGGYVGERRGAPQGRTPSCKRSDERSKTAAGCAVTSEGF